MTTRTSFGPPPASDFAVAPTRDEVELFRENGYLVVDRITTDEEVDWLRPIFEAAFDESDGKMAPQKAKANIQTMFPEFRYRELLDTTYLRNAKTYAAALLGVDETVSWGHMIRKPVVGSRLAPWHQDEAYWEPELEYHALASWLPLHDVTVEMGAMQFIPGSHKAGVLDHVFYGDTPPGDNLLEAIGVDVSKAVACPLRKGGCTFHDKNTLHFTEPNTTDQPRYAYPIEHQIVPRWRDTPVKRDWVDRYRAASGATVPDGYIADGKLIKFE